MAEKQQQAKTYYKTSNRRSWRLILIYAYFQILRNIVEHK